MNKFSNKILKAFTLMEIGLSLLIVSILVIVCIPIVINQAKKTDEYSYYLAYKTVEKMGSQIVAFGDPEIVIEQNQTSYNPVQNIFKKYVITYADKFMKILNPSAHAAIQTSPVVSFTSYEYDYVRLCLGNVHVEKDFDEHAGMLYSADEITAIQSEPNCTNYKNNNYDLIKKRFIPRNLDPNLDILSILSTEAKSARDYCKYIAQHTDGADNCDSETCYKFYVYHDDSDDSYKDESDDSKTYNKSYWECTITIHDPESSEDISEFNSPSDTTLSYAVPCSNYGLVNMTNANTSGDINCTCAPDAPIKAVNNSLACCGVPPSGKFPYYSHIQKECKYCYLGSYNEKTGDCCPITNEGVASIYSPSLEKCVCPEGYFPDNPNNLSSCSIVEQNCPAGSHLKYPPGTDNNSCVTNSPIVKANRFCQLVDYYWNVSSSDCETFSEVDGIEFNTDLYNAITADNTPYLSTKAVEGAFRNITPNIVFANGLMMWILGDKSASMAGLSFNPDHYTTTKVNICKETNDNENACKGGTDNDKKYFCKNDAKCFSINIGEQTINDKTVPRVEDARNCCSAVDFSDLIPMFAGSDYLRDPRTYAISGFTVFIDINGKKDNDEMGGGGTLWKDVFPFYIATNGKVYPGYPLNAVKNSDGYSGLYQGGNSSALSADVYYYKIENGRRRKTVVYPSIPLARALCFSMEISAYTPYCQNLGSKYRLINTNKSIDNFINSNDNPCYQNRCFLKVKNKIKFL